MSEFVEECRREWKRLRVSDPVANEMAADLAADLREAEAEGASAEQVLGSAAFDPRAFAASWASARGVIGTQPTAVARPDVVRPVHLHGWPVRSAIVAAVLIATIFVGLAIASVRSGSTSVAVAAAPAARQPAPSGAFLPPIAFGPTRTAGRLLPAFGLLVLMIGVVGLILWFVYWSPWAASVRSGRRRSSIDDGLGGPGIY